VNYLENYIIPFKNLKNGMHIYDFIVDNKFFDQYERSEVKEGNLIAIVNLDRQTTFLSLDISIEGSINVLCDRCLDPFEMEFKNSDKIILKFGEEITDARYIGEDIEVFGYNETEINVAQFLYEIIHVGLPLKKIHKDDSDGNSECNSETLDGFNKHLEDDVEDSETDPRWDKLKNILNKN